MLTGGRRSTRDSPRAVDAYGDNAGFGRDSNTVGTVASVSIPTNGPPSQIEIIPPSADNTSV